MLDEYVKAQADHPMPRKRTNGRNIYLSHNDFGDLKSYVMLPKIVDFGLAQQVVGKDLLRHPIQPPLYHAPEVLLGIPWSYSADIWNLGVLVRSLRHIERTDTNEGNFYSFSSYWRTSIYSTISNHKMGFTLHKHILPK